MADSLDLPGDPMTCKAFAELGDKLRCQGNGLVYVRAKDGALVPFRREMVVVVYEVGRG